uniref:Uncharacterized protein n=1 Tax=Bionectria ochroleuca TaxID=29856 RepID=A0A8H7N0K8_BIOOC
MLTSRCSALPRHAYNAGGRNAGALATDLSAGSASGSTLTAYILSKFLGSRLLDNKSLVQRAATAPTHYEEPPSQPTHRYGLTAPYLLIHVFKPPDRPRI